MTMAKAGVQHTMWKYSSPGGLRPLIVKYRNNPTLRLLLRENIMIYYEIMNDVQMKKEEKEKICIPIAQVHMAEALNPNKFKNPK